MSQESQKPVVNLPVMTPVALDQGASQTSSAVNPLLRFDLPDHDDLYDDPPTLTVAEMEEQIARMDAEQHEIDSLEEKEIAERIKPPSVSVSEYEEFMKAQMDLSQLKTEFLGFMSTAKSEILSEIEAMKTARSQLEADSKKALQVFDRMIERGEASAKQAQDIVASSVHREREMTATLKQILEQLNEKTTMESRIQRQLEEMKAVPGAITAVHLAEVTRLEALQKEIENAKKTAESRDPGLYEHTPDTANVHDVSARVSSSVSVVAPVTAYITFEE